MMEEAYGPDHPQVALTLTTWAPSSEQLGELPAARATFERALAMMEAAYGPDHPEVARTRTDMNIIQQQLDDQ